MMVTHYTYQHWLLSIRQLDRWYQCRIWLLLGCFVLILAWLAVMARQCAVGIHVWMVRLGGVRVWRWACGGSRTAIHQQIGLWQQLLVANVRWWWGWRWTSSRAWRYIHNMRHHRSDTLLADWCATLTTKPIGHSFIVKTIQFGRLYQKKSRVKWVFHQTKYQ